MAMRIGLGLLAFQLLSGSSYLILPLLFLLLLIPDLAVTAKRWHDRDKTSWWLLLYLPSFLGQMIIPSVNNTLMGNEQLYQLGMAVNVTSIVCSLWILIECGFMRGTSGDNRFGKEPD